MANSVFEEIAKQIHYARRMNGRKPDYVILGYETKNELFGNLDPEQRMYLELHRDIHRIAGIEILYSTKESEIGTAYRTRII